MNPIERMFQEDIQEKKKAGRGSFSRKGRGVKHHMSGIKTPYDYLSTKEKKKLNSTVRSYNMNTILNKIEFDQADQETQKMLLMKWRETHINKTIAKEMGISVSEFSRIVQSLDLPRPPKKPRATRQAAVKKIEATQAFEQPQKETLETLEKKGGQIKVEPIQQAPIKLITIGSHLEYNGIYNATQIERILMKAQLHIEGEPGQYYLTLAITEKEDKS